ncbi:type VI immunity family protein [Wielerella bovis]|uniref:type VI immunity family protein n=1 Tax=Wielerella bovis TaxID=2917790 RepID=UPI00201920D5|nr:type VI immunity family protein [Wielerella bovis]ULJ63732.1 DUF3396 domain-containing protein [Wielerella bovis]ULJ66757.1 DUF3396 domain-containing protein [Wielerella bovis]
MTEQEQKNRLNDIMFHAQRCRLHDDEQREYGQMGLGITIYFYGGGSATGQQKVLEVFRRYQERYGEFLKGLFFDKHQRFAKFTIEEFEKSIEKSKKLALQDEGLEAHLSSERWGDYATDYRCSSLTTSPTGESEYNQLSYLRLIFPIDWLKSKSKQQEFEAWIEYLCAEFDVFHGYAGLECVLSYGYEEWRPHEYQVATHYYNVMPNSGAFMGKLTYTDAAKSISWYTLLGKSLFHRIKPQVWHRLAVQYPEIIVKPRDNGVFIIKIDDLPDVGDAAEPLPLNYQALNEALRPILKAVPNRLHGFYEAPHFNAVKTYYWAHRWDNPNMKDGVLDEAGKIVKTHPILVEGNEGVRVSHSGIWQPFNHDGEAVYLEKGNLFPEVEKPEDLLAATLWRLVSRDDGGTLFVVPDFRTR